MPKMTVTIQKYMFGGYKKKEDAPGQKSGNYARIMGTTVNGATVNAIAWEGAARRLDRELMSQVPDGMDLGSLGLALEMTGQERMVPKKIGQKTVEEPIFRMDAENGYRLLMGPAHEIHKARVNAAAALAEAATAEANGDIQRAKDVLQEFMMRFSQVASLTKELEVTEDLIAAVEAEPEPVAPLADVTTAESVEPHQLEPSVADEAPVSEPEPTPAVAAVNAPAFDDVSTAAITPVSSPSAPEGTSAGDVVLSVAAADQPEAPLADAPDGSDILSAAPTQPLETPIPIEPLVSPSVAPDSTGGRPVEAAAGFGGLGLMRTRGFSEVGKESYLPEEAPEISASRELGVVGEAKPHLDYDEDPITMEMAPAAPIAPMDTAPKSAPSFQTLPPRDGFTPVVAPTAPAAPQAPLRPFSGLRRSPGAFSMGMGGRR